MQTLPESLKQMVDSMYEELHAKPQLTRGS
jgi:hypothetical protein